MRYKMRTNGAEPLAASTSTGTQATGSHPAKRIYRLRDLQAVLLASQQWTDTEFWPMHATRSACQNSLTNRARSRRVGTLRSLVRYYAQSQQRQEEWYDSRPHEN